MYQSVPFFESSLCRQRSVRGRLGKIGWNCCPSHRDMLLLQTVCSRHNPCSCFQCHFEDYELLLVSSWEALGEMFQMDDEEDALLRARTCIGERMLNSSDETERDEGLKIIEAIAEKGEVWAMLNIGYMCEFGLNGLNVDKKRARTLFQKCARLGSYEASEHLLLLESNMSRKTTFDRSDVKPENEKVWKAYLHGLMHNRVFIHDLSSSSFIICWELHV